MQQSEYTTRDRYIQWISMSKSFSAEFIGESFSKYKVRYCQTYTSSEADFVLSNAMAGFRIRIRMDLH